MPLSMELSFEWPTETLDLPTPIDLDIVDDLVVATASSIWVISKIGYIRLPRNGHTRDAPTSLNDHTFVDGAMIEYRDAYFFHEGVGWRLQLVPRDRPADAYGIHTGRIERGSVPPPSLSRTS